MGRPIYPHELADNDFLWLINQFEEQKGEYAIVDNSTLPVVFIKSELSFLNEERSFLEEGFNDETSPTAISNEDILQKLLDDLDT